MAQPKSRTTRVSDEYGTSFAVTCVIGRVSLTPDADQSPHEAAFALIAMHDAPGEYTFPMADGRTCVVAVTHADTNGGRDVQR